MVRVIAHRGASAQAPENTVEAFGLARDLGADWVELDARRTADGGLAVHHDAALADGRMVMDLDLAALPDGLCDLASALVACEGMSVNIEIKNWPDDPDFDPAESVAHGVVATVQRHQRQETVLISCFHRPTIDLVRELDPSIPTALLGFQGPDGWDELVRGLADAGHRAVHPWYPMVQEEMVSKAHDAGLEVNVWTVNDSHHMADLVERGVDGICTDLPDVARKLLDRRFGVPSS